MDEERIDYSQTLRRGDPVLATYRVGGKARTARVDVVIEPGERGGVQHTSIDRPIDFYKNRRHIEVDQWRAGIRYFKLWNYSILRARYVTMRYGDDGGEFDPVDHALAPKQYLDAQKAIQDERARETVFQVCCMDIKAGKRGGMLFLRSGLDDLLAHFKRTSSKFRIDT